MGRSAGGTAKTALSWVRQGAVPSPRLLLICSPSDRETLKAGFEALGFEVRTANHDVAGISTAYDLPADLVAVDHSDNAQQRLQWCYSFRASVKGSTIPLIALTRPDQEDLRVSLFAAGVDDCLTGSITSGESELRIRSVLRRAAMPAHPTGELRYADVTLDALQFKAWRGGTRIPLTVLQFKLLQFLMMNPERIFSPEELRRHVWDAAPIEKVTIVKCISRLRLSLNTAGGGELIRRTRNGGYSLDKCASETLPKIG